MADSTKVLSVDRCYTRDTLPKMWTFLLAACRRVTCASAPAGAELERVPAATRSSQEAEIIDVEDNKNGEAHEDELFKGAVEYVGCGVPVGLCK